MYRNPEYYYKKHKICMYCKRPIEGGLYTEIWNGAFAAHRIGYAHRPCADEAERESDKRSFIFLIAAITFVSAALIVSEIIYFIIK